MSAEAARDPATRRSRERGEGIMKILRSVPLVLFILSGALLFPTFAGETRVEEVPQLCPGLNPSERPIIAVMDFKVKVDVTGDVGGGMASMLSNALLNSGCFTVVERERLDDVMSEQAFGMSGAVEESSAPSAGRLKGARYQVMGEITEFSDNESGAAGAARSVGRLFGRGRVSQTAGSVAVRKAHIGFIIKVVDTTTGVVIGSQSFDKKRTSAGFAAADWAGSRAFAGSGQISKAMADAIEEGIIGAIQYIAPYRSQMVGATPAAQAAAASTALKPGDCALMQRGRPAPRVMVIIPEEHIMGMYGSYGEGRAFKFDEYEADRDMAPSSGSTAADAMAAAQRMIRPPDPAGETEIVKRFLEHGFYMVDEKQMAKLREEQRFRQANNDVALASAIGREFDADIVITGEAFSEFSKNINGMMSCRARVEAKAIESSSGRIIAADGLHAAAVDVSEVIAGKAALRNAGGKVADYFITQICNDPRASYDSGAGVAGGGAVTELVVNNIDFMGSSRMQKALDALEVVTAVEKGSFRDGTTTFLVTHSGSTDQLAEAMLVVAEEFPLEILELESGRIVADRR
jgi:curli biogenesis system outer membrane secretion channel CsgG